jgi:hypothetical protein
VDLAATYYKAIDTLEAQEELQRLIAHDWPNSEKSYRGDKFKDLQRRAFPKSFTSDGQEKPVTTVELGERLKRVMRGR